MVCFCLPFAHLSLRLTRPTTRLYSPLPGYFRLATAKKNLNELDAAADVIKARESLLLAFERYAVE